MYVCMDGCMDVYMYLCTLYVCMCVCMYVHMYVCMYVYMYGWMDVYMYLCTLYVCMYVCMCVYIYTAECCLGLKDAIGREPAKLESVLIHQGHHVGMLE